MLDLVGMEIGEHSITYYFKNCDGSFVWIFTWVYDPSLTRDREVLWVELRAIKGLWDNSWCIKGDFNIVRFLGEYNGPSRLSLDIRFYEIIEDLQLRDLPLNGGSFTLSEGLNNQS